ncbi:hypothetical protein CCP2SC5_30095 [Azospirillaceae bacterium]
MSSMEMDNDFELSILDGVPEDELQDYLVWRERVKNANISNKTLLATDFLNHFNEIVMLIEMIPDMPMMLDECYLWKPKTYQEHFQDSGFSEKALAIEAYNHVPSKFRRPFEETLSQMTLIVNFTLQKIANNIAANDEEDCDSPRPPSK